MILEDDQPVLVEQRRTGRAVIVVEGSEGSVPDHAAVEIDGDDALVAERRIDALAVGCRRRGRGAVLLMKRLGGPVGVHRLPQQLAVRAVEREHRHAPIAAGRGDEEAILPDDRRRVAAARHRGTPEHVLGGRPAIDVSRVGREALTARTAPAGPVQTKPRRSRQPSILSVPMVVARREQRRGRRGSKGRRGRRGRRFRGALCLCASAPLRFAPLRSAPLRSVSSAPSASSSHP